MATQIRENWEPTREVASFYRPHFKMSCKSLKGCDCSPHKQNRVGNIGALYLAYPYIGRKKEKKKKKTRCMHVL